jgi:uncharacterized membrane protein YqhA
MKHLLERARFAVAPVAIALAILAFVVFLWAGAQAVSLIVDLFRDEGWKRDALVGRLLGTFDLFLIGSVILIVAAGMWELFVGDLDLPDILTVSDLTALKQKVSDLLVLVLAIQFAKRFLSGTAGIDLLYAGASVALVGGTLVLFTLRQKPGAKPGPQPAGGDEAATPTSGPG